MAYTAIDDPTKYFQTKKYTGNGTAIGSGGLSVTFDDTAFQPDLVWSKNKDDGTGHRWTDSARGVTKQFFSNNANVSKAIDLFIKNLKAFKRDINKKNNKLILKKLIQTKKVRSKIIKLKQDINKPDFGRN